MLEAFDGLRLLVAPEGWFPAAWAWMRLLGFSPFGVATVAFDVVLTGVLVLTAGTTAAEFEGARRRVGTLAAAADAAGDGLLQDEAA